MTHKEIVAKIGELRPGAIFALTGDTYDGLVWLSPEISKPTPEELGL